jgi:hypothetical protein
MNGVLTKCDLTSGIITLAKVKENKPANKVITRTVAKYRHHSFLP